jgi:uncharacterized membrane protein
VSAPRFDSERDERYTHRLESFSDVVIAFSLAQTSLNFSIPHRAIDIYTQPIALTAFAVTFAVVAAFWWSHHRLFDGFFVPRRSTVFLNFVALALLVWLIFQLQLFLRFEGTSSAIAALVGYVATYALVYFVLALLCAICVRIRWPQLDELGRRRGVEMTGRIVGIVVGTLVGLAISLPLGHPELSFFGIVAGVLVWRAAAPAVVRRLRQ